jgi:hypothetical protein
VGRGLAFLAAIAALLPIQTIGDAAKERWWDDPPPRHAKISDIRTERGWTYREYIDETKRPARLGKAWLTWPGASVSFDVDISGYRDAQLEATGWVLNAGSGERVKALWGAVAPDNYLESSRSRIKQSSDIWVALPKARGRYKITVALYGADAQLAEVSSKPFSIR